VSRVFYSDYEGWFRLISLGIADIPVTSSVIGLNPSYTNLLSFVAAAGYAEAAAMYNLSDPPFVQGGWAVAPFQVTPRRLVTHDFNTNGIIFSVPPRRYTQFHYISEHYWSLYQHLMFSYEGLHDAQHIRPRKLDTLRIPP